MNNLFSKAGPRESPPVGRKSTTSQTKLRISPRAHRPSLVSPYSSQHPIVLQFKFLPQTFNIPIKLLPIFLPSKLQYIRQESTNPQLTLLHEHACEPQSCAHISGKLSARLSKGARPSPISELWRDVLYWNGIKERQSAAGDKMAGIFQRQI